MKISEILSKYDTDKQSHHGYGDVYDILFGKYNRDEKLRILEVGTQKGGSLLAWKEFFPNADVWGVDVVDVVPEKYRLDTVTRVVSDIKEWKDETRWDIVIDDGSHYLADMVYVVSQYCRKLNVGGLIVIEDVRFPELLNPVIVNLLQEIRLGFPDNEADGSFKIANFNKTRKGHESSYIIAMTKEPL